MGLFNSVLVIVNPIAGSGKAGRMIPELHKRLEKFSIPYTLTETQAPDHATQISRKAAKEGFDAVCAVGGDGTVNEVINGLGEDGPAFGIIPLGTGNDLARTMGIPLAPLESVALLNQGSVRKIDLGRNTDRLFSIIAGLGFPAEVMQRTNSYRGMFRGSMAIAYNVIKTISLLKPVPMELDLDGNRFSRMASGLFILNTRFTGGGLMVAPDADPEDGLLDVVIMNNLSKGGLLGLLPRVYKGGHRNHPQVEFFRAREISITTASPYPKMFDGSIYGTSPLQVEVIPRKFKIICPEEV